ncbi:hypothetical protein AYL99_03147 [Fonsecaea erecta]|uniref:Uncharacterized protein n=1 Tax=Fonsecaea erecta TaxID=1367422 RepID=A0A178ZVU5_9EURO|nr:hypothetical protein AYL99_03147 [Fonsecaea erecta]OAP63920.1 hypothetical protein AYL99_03147 [Fonsecaea erecta]
MSEADYERDNAQAKICLGEIERHRGALSTHPLPQLNACANTCITTRGLEHNYLAITRRTEPTSVQREYANIKKYVTRTKGRGLLISIKLFSRKTFLGRCL